MKAANELVEVYAGSTIEVGIVQSFLSSAEVDSYLQNEIVGTLAPWWSSPGGAGAIKLLVAKADAETAKMLIKEYEENRAS